MILHQLTDDGMTTYRYECLPENLGWVILKTDLSFVIAHRIYNHPEDGPVVLIADTVFEIDPDAHAIYPTEDGAKDAYYATPPGTAIAMRRLQFRAGPNDHTFYACAEHRARLEAGDWDGLFFGIERDPVIAVDAADETKCDYCREG